ncbi:hypothetical protein CPAST_c23540 [Clostridium pasteurianum DSM 525 = ATCC 6013]|uniref:Peptidoglycan-binding domain 1 protein n=1 Tax=Clostridium pasteurianum DSM 525 = ATCC 6013 TaxID=1262449 RepID=A0A0H3J4L2_CLOPA|nr:peptidoglycan-binding domain-containing protein [Clostridium pasteurianum]AJA48424.1 hypothetical protein CPAST_c23540 [Clostridium pasteurianum DSM 525 = ATCC 6013]AJA52412.1 hypothetical protein CLPA_c23540 [Clostridium pasteurianum DSM 525 = ATCC 6013]AOZ75669.1 hypothetical protein AQ983_11445 [Clostridium pasteurianum DSM 525 = ATCC 6013]AOZ79465.1 hypothetical protein AQ984_11440 [Clostridium pasteurianum]ELP60426.1 zinc carboxypeptidase [Clostridium pasteurianum DSM 525 = ATCC 6013]
MKSKKIKVLTLGLLTTLIISSTPVFATTSTSTNSHKASTINNKPLTTSTTNKDTNKSTPTIPGTVKIATAWGEVGFWYVWETKGYVSYGDTGFPVRCIQEGLNNLGYNCGYVDGVFGSNTLTQVKRFQHDNGLVADGLVGPNTYDVLRDKNGWYN